VQHNLTGASVKLLFLGISSALSTGYKAYQSNMLLKSPSDHTLLIDCGTDIKHSLFEQQLTHSDIDAVYISHLHADHVGGLEWLGFSKRFVDKQKPKLYISSIMQDGLWQNVLSGGMSSLEDESATLSSFFDIQPIEKNRFVWENHTFELISVFHSINNGKRLPCFGLLIKGPEQTIFISTDSRFSPAELMPIYKQADLIFQDCELSTIPTGQHANYKDLKTLAPDIKAKMWLYDYETGTQPNAKQDGFKGLVIRGQSFTF